MPTLHLPLPLPLPTVAWRRLFDACRPRPLRPRRMPCGEALDRVHLPLRGARGCAAARFLPAGDGDAAVILMPPARGAGLPARRLVAELRALGLTVLAIEPPAHGRPPHEAAALLGAVDYLLERGCEPGRIGALGASAGAAAALAAATREVAIGAVAADSARVDPAVLSLAARRSPVPAAGWCVRLLAACGVRTAADVALLRGRPVLVIHSDHDPVVPVAHGLALAQATQSRLWVTSSRSHAGSLRDDPGAYCAVVLRFFTHHLLADAQPLACDRGPAALQPATGRPF